MLVIADKKFNSRLFTGTGKFGSYSLMREAIIASGSELVTVAFRRAGASNDNGDDIIKYLQIPGVALLPNTSGVRNAKEAVLMAELAREALETHWVKLEIHPDPKYLMPDPVETLNAATDLVKRGFIVLPYCHADPVLCKRLEEAGCPAVMPLGSPIGSASGLQTKAMLEIIIDQSNIPVIVDAGIGAPSHAAEAMEMGAHAVLVNTAIAVAGDPVQMANAFRLSVEAGRMAFEAKLGTTKKEAEASSPLTGFLGV
ncbi:MAG: thiazole synthase [Bacteroidetes bacterium]|nr:thiazole synthase [Bacteroidota bacterium]